MNRSTDMGQHGEWLDPEELLRLALNASSENKAEAAITYLKRAIGQTPTDARLHYLLGAEHAQLGLYDRAAEGMRRAVDLDPSLDTAHFQLGLLHLTSGRVEDAQRCWQPLDRLSAEHPLRLFKVGLLHLARDEFAACAEHLKRGIATNTMNAALSSDMQKILTDVEGKLTANSGSAISTAAAPAPADTSRHVLLNAYRKSGDKDPTKH